MMFHVLLIILTSISTAVSGEATAAAYVPTEVYLINCGDLSDNVDGSNRNWTAENQNLLLLSNSSSLDALHQDSGVPRIPYMKARVSRSDFTYNFPVSPGWKFLRLYFYPTRYSSEFDAINSFFSVKVNGFTLLNNFSADLTAKAFETPTVIKEFIVPVHHTLNLTFTPSKNSLAFVNGIEIVSMPDMLYSKGGFDDVITNSGSVDFHINNSTAFETVHRLNVGGQFVSEVDDSGLFRRWFSDDNFMLGVNSGITQIVPDIKINYTVKTPAYVAPEDVYATSRAMGNKENPKLNANFNMTWLFTVDAGFDYLIRLHFCETMKEVNRDGQRVFSVFIENQTYTTEMDVFRLAGGSWIPMYKDYHVFVDSGSGLRHDIRLDLHPLVSVTPKYYDVILNGVEVLKLNNTDGNLAGPNPDLPPPNQPPRQSKPRIRKGNNNKSHVLVIILAVVGSSVVLVAMLFVGVVIMKKKKKSKKKSNEVVSVHNTSKTKSSWGPLPHDSGSTNTKSATSLPSDLCRQFSIFEIKSATNNFEEKLIVGSGGFGPVYKGRIDDGATFVAVKRLEITSNQGAKEFQTELEMLSNLRHIHLVSLIGYCDEDNEMILVYEYMSHGTLRDHLYKRDKASNPPLSWKQRLNICIGAARGLQYLHTGAKQTIIHRDIKTTNILLDENLVAKVSDFGLSRVGPTSASQTHVSTVVKGTFGYLDPEYFRRQILTEKSDVYSFGVVLFEVLCCRPIKMQNVPREQADLIRWVKSNYKKGTVDQIIDQDLTGDITSESLDKFCEIAMRCVEDRGIERPSMNDVVWALTFALQLHETAKEKKNKSDKMETIHLMARGYDGKTTDGEDELFSNTTGHAKSTTTDDDSAPLVGDNASGSSWGVFSEIKDPKAR